MSSTEPRHDAQVQTFVEALRAFLAFVDRFQELDEHQRTDQAVRSLTKLYTAALDLPAVDTKAPVERAHPEPPPMGTGFEIQYYWNAFDPFETGGGGLGDLSDDIGDIYSDLKRGLASYEEGDTNAAIWEWRFGFEFHWGVHAVDALRVLHRLLGRQRNGMKTKLVNKTDAS